MEKINEIASLNNIYTRTSIRNFKKTKITKDIEDAILKAAMSAPTACNMQPWHFIVVNDPETIDMMTESHLAYDSPLKIIVCAKRIAHQVFAINDSWIQDCSAATENILLAANALGLGSCWQIVYPVDSVMHRIRKMFNIPQEYVPVSMVDIGYPIVTKPPLDKFDENKISYNRF